jgi:hypothetical protein
MSQISIGTAGLVGAFERFLFLLGHLLRWPFPLRARRRSRGPARGAAFFSLSLSARNQFGVGGFEHREKPLARPRVGSLALHLLAGVFLLRSHSELCCCEIELKNLIPKG